MCERYGGTYWCNGSWEDSHLFKPKQISINSSADYVAQKIRDRCCAASCISGGNNSGGRTSYKGIQWQIQHPCKHMRAHNLRQLRSLVPSYQVL
jgi:hypothetical protein